MNVEEMLKTLEKIKTQEKISINKIKMLKKEWTNCVTDNKFVESSKIEYIHRTKNYLSYKQSLIADILSLCDDLDIDVDEI
jgi:predicted N-acyltransferase